MSGALLICDLFSQVLDLFPSSRGLELIWSSVVKIGQSLYREAPGIDPYRPDQKTPVKNFFLAGSYTKQVIEYLFHICFCNYSLYLNFFHGSEGLGMLPQLFAIIWYIVQFIFPTNFSTSIVNSDMLKKPYCHRTVSS